MWCKSIYNNNPKKQNKGDIGISVSRTICKISLQECTNIGMEVSVNVNRAYFKSTVSFTLLALMKEKQSILWA